MRKTSPFTVRRAAMALILAAAGLLAPRVAHAQG